MVIYLLIFIHRENLGFHNALYVVGLCCAVEPGSLHNSHGIVLADECCLSFGFFYFSIWVCGHCVMPALTITQTFHSPPQSQFNTIERTVTRLPENRSTIRYSLRFHLELISGSAQIHLPLFSFCALAIATTIIIDRSLMDRIESISIIWDLGEQSTSASASDGKTVKWRN